MADAIDLLANQSIQMRNEIFQPHMVLDYLLAEGVCGKLSESNCCLQIDDNGKVVEQITKDMRKLAHVPIQIWKGWEPDMFLWLAGGLWIKRALSFLLCAAAGLLFAPCQFLVTHDSFKHMIQEMQLSVMPS